MTLPNLGNRKDLIREFIRFWPVSGRLGTNKGRVTRYNPPNNQPNGGPVTRYGLYRTHRYSMWEILRSLGCRWRYQTRMH